MWFEVIAKRNANNLSILCDLVTTTYNFPLFKDGGDEEEGSEADDDEDEDQDEDDQEDDEDQEEEDEDGIYFSCVYWRQLKFSSKLILNNVGTALGEIPVSYCFC